MYTGCLRNGETWPETCECDKHTAVAIPRDGGGYCPTISAAQAINAPNTSSNTLYNTFGAAICTDITNRHCPAKKAKLVKFCDHWKIVGQGVMCPCSLTDVRNELRQAYLTAWTNHDTTAFPAGSGKGNAWWSRSKNIEYRDRQISSYLNTWVSSSDVIPGCSTAQCDTSADGVPVVMTCNGYPSTWGGQYNPDPS